jgi:hypothetical protein
MTQRRADIKSFFNNTTDIKSFFKTRPKVIFKDRPKVRKNDVTSPDTTSVDLTNRHKFIKNETMSGRHEIIFE